MLFACHLHALVFYLCTRILFVCELYILVCHPYVTRMYSYVTRMYSHVIRISLVCTRMSSVCHSYVLVCHSHVTRMYSMSSVCPSSVVLPWTFLENKLLMLLKFSEKTKGNSQTVKQYITQHNATNLNENSVLNAIKLLLMENLLKNTPTKEKDSYYIVSENSSTAVISDNNDMKWNSQEETPSNEEIPN